MRLTLIALIALACALGYCQSPKPLLSASGGSTFVELEYGDWQNAYSSTIDPRVGFSYTGVGSGAGQKLLLVNHSVEYACSDSPLSAAQYAAVPDAQLLPMTIGAVVPFYHLPAEFTEVNLVLTRELLVSIFSGNITRWNDPRLQAVNFLTLPDAPITVVHRTDSSGTTNIFTSALGSFSPEWKYGTVSLWPPKLPGIQVGGDGNPGVYSIVQSTDNSIGYVSYSFIINIAFLRNAYATIINKAGNAMRATPEAVTESTIDASFNAFYAATITDSPRPNAWPISGFSYVIVRKNSTIDCTPLKIAYDMFTWAQTTYAGQYLASYNGFAPFPPSLYQPMLANWGFNVTCPNGVRLQDFQVNYPVPPVDLSLL